MRTIINDLGKELAIESYNHYGIKIARKTLPPSARIQLEQSGVNRHFIECADEIYIYDGAGELKLSQCQRGYDFSDIKPKELEIYLLHGKLSLQNAQSYIDFKELAELNLAQKEQAKGVDLISPPRYQELWEIILASTKESQCSLVKL